MTKTVIFSANRGYALISSREAIIVKFLDEGWQVVLATADDDEARYLVGLGAKLEPVKFNRGGFAPILDWRAWRRMCAIYSRWRPDIVHHFHGKPIILGTLAARQMLGSVPAVVNTITGLGHAFINGGLAARLVSAGYKLALPQSDVTIFQNRDDRQLFLERGWVQASKARLIIGSGINLSRFEYCERKGRKVVPIVIMIGRLLRQKGIPEFVEVAREIKKRWPEVRFLLAGEEDHDHPDSVTPKWIRDMGNVEYLGRLSDVRTLLAQADIMLFPSYREGVPRAVMEAALTGLPVIAFDVPGVREAVRHEETGYLVPFRDVSSLTERLVELIQDPQIRLAMGLAAKKFTERNFDIKRVHKDYFDVYNEFGVSFK